MTYSSAAFLWARECQLFVGSRDLPLCVSLQAVQLLFWWAGQRPQHRTFLLRPRWTVLMKPKNSPSSSPLRYAPL